MLTGAVSRRSTAPAPRSRYERAWTAAVVVTAAVWVGSALLETPLLPLLDLTVPLGAFGGIVFVRAPWRSRAARRQYARGAAQVAVVVLVLVGVRHHFELGMASAALLLGSAPALIRWTAGH
jgi:hypothetical protein